MISIPMPVRLGLIVLTGTEAVTLRFADSALAGEDGVKVRLPSQEANAANAKGAVGQAELPSPLETNGTPERLFFPPLKLASLKALLRSSLPRSRKSSASLRSNAMSLQERCHWWKLR